MTALRIGFMPLTDAAGLTAAVDFGFAEAEGLEIELHKEVSWANLRDKLMVGHLDAAHFLGAATIAASLGIGQRRFPVRAPLALNRTGNAITLATRVAEELLTIDPMALDDWRLTATTLAKCAARRRDAGKSSLIFGTVYPFSTHTYLLRRFLAEGGLDPELDVEIVVTPPPFAPDLADRGLVDGFCVGSPWNSFAVESGKGVIAALGSEILQNAPEKVLAVPEGSPLLTSETGERLVRAIVAASEFAGSPENLEKMAERLSREDRIHGSPEIIGRTLAGDLILDSRGRRRRDPDFVRLSGPGVHRPSREDAGWLFDQMIAARQAGSDAGLGRSEAEQVFSPALFDRAMAG